MTDKSTSRESALNMDDQLEEFERTRIIRENAIERLKRLPIGQIMETLDVTPARMESHLQVLRQLMSEKVVSILDKRWETRSDSVRVVLSEWEIPELDFRTLKDLKRAAKRQSLSLHQLQTLVDLFEDDDGEYRRMY